MNGPTDDARLLLAQAMYIRDHPDAAAEEGLPPVLCELGPMALNEQGVNARLQTFIIGAQAALTFVLAAAQDQGLSPDELLRAAALRLAEQPEDSEGT